MTTRLRYDGIETYLDAQLEQDSTLITFTTALDHDGGQAIPTLAGDEHLALTILDSNFVLQEIVHLTAYVEGALSGTVLRAQEGTLAKTHAAGNKVVHSPTAEDFLAVQEHDSDPQAHEGAMQAIADAAVANGIAAHVAEENPHPQYARLDDLSEFTEGAYFPPGSELLIDGTLRIGPDATLIVEGDLVVDGRIFINGRQLYVGNDAPDPPDSNMVWIQTFGE